MFYWCGDPEKFVFSIIYQNEDENVNDKVNENVNNLKISENQLDIIYIFIDENVNDKERLLKRPLNDKERPLKRPFNDDTKNHIFF